MAVFKTIARGSIKLLFGFLLLITLCYLLLLAINWQDAKPNAASLQMQSLLQHPPIPAAQNGYQYYLAHHANSELLLTGPLQDLYRQCSEAQTCTEALAAQTDLAELVAEQHQLMTFYTELLQYPHWQEPPPTLENIPAYQLFLHSQRLFLWQAWLDAQEGDIEQAQTALTKDYQFWKNVLANNNTVIGKMISAAAVNHHFMLGTVIISQLPADQRLAAIPDGWNVAFSDSELGLEMALAGEWYYGADILADVWLDTPDKNESPGTFEAIFDRLVRPLFLLQDTKNVHAQQLLQQEEQPTYPWYSWLRNPSGRLLIASSVPLYSDYKQRLQQLEPLRLQALQQVE